MNTLESMRVALGALRANKLRSGLTMLGIIIGVAAIVCVESVGAGARAEVSEKIRTLGANLLLVMPGAPRSGAVRLETGAMATLTEDDAATILRQVPSVQVAAPLLSRSKHLVAGDRNWVSLVAGINPDYLVAREWRISSGRFFAPSELDWSAKVAIVGTVIEDELFPGRSAVGETLRIGDVPFTIIGVLDKKGLGAAGRSQDDVVFIPLTTAKSRVLGAVRGNSRESLDFVSIKVSDADAIDVAKQEIEALLRQRHRIRGDAASDFTIDNPADVLTAREGAVRVLDLLLLAVASVSLLVGGISIMNIMIVSVTERTREIGLRMAIGARGADIAFQFLVEALAIAFVGGMLGSLLGTIAAVAIALEANWPVLISPWTILLSFGFSGFIGAIFGLYPAHRAAQLDPIVALRFE